MAIISLELTRVNLDSCHLVMTNLIQLLVSVMSHCSQTFSVDFLRFLLKPTFEEFEEICEQICKEKEIQYNDETKMIDSNIDLLTNSY